MRHTRTDDKPKGVQPQAYEKPVVCGAGKVVKHKGMSKEQRSSRRAMVREEGTRSSPLSTAEFSKPLVLRPWQFLALNYY